MKILFLLVTTLISTSAFAAFNCAKINFEGKWKLAKAGINGADIFVTLTKTDSGFAERDDETINGFGRSYVHLDLTDTLDLKTCTLTRTLPADTNHTTYSLLFNLNLITYTKIEGIGKSVVIVNDCAQADCSDIDYTKSYPWEKVTTATVAE